MSVATVPSVLTTVTTASDICNQRYLGLEGEWKMSLMDLGIISIQGRPEQDKPGMGTFPKSPLDSGVDQGTRWLLFGYPLTLMAVSSSLCLKTTTSDLTFS